MKRASHLRPTLLAVVVFLGPMIGNLQAQGCAMCKSSIAAQADNIVAAINTGILVLLVPPLVILTAILHVAFKRGG